MINSLKERFTQPLFVAYERKYIDTMYNEELNYHSLTNEIDTLKVILNEVLLNILITS